MILETTDLKDSRVFAIQRNDGVKIQKPGIYSPFIRLSGKTVVLFSSIQYILVKAGSKVWGLGFGVWGLGCIQMHAAIKHLR